MKVVKKITAVFLSVLFIFLTFSIMGFADTTEAEESIPTDFISAVSKMISHYDSSFGASSGGVSETCRIIVKTQTSKPLSDDQGALDKVEGWNCIHILQYPDSTTANSALEFYLTQDYVVYAEMDTYFEVSSSPSSEVSTLSESTEENVSWGTSAVKLDVLNDYIENNNLIKSDEEIVVAVFDTGLTENHHMFDVDRFYPGYNLFDYNTDTSDPYGFGHGTHITGIIYENTLPNVKFRPYRANEKFSQTFQTAYSIIGTALMTAVDNGDDLINISMWWSDSPSQYIEDAIDYAYDNNVPIIVAAGNDEYGTGYNADEVCYPALNEKVITVAAVDSDFEPVQLSKCGNISSNYGTCVDVAAPGCMIKSASNNIYQKVYACGTSMAAPYVSAAVAMIKSVYPDLSCSVIADIITSSVVVPDGWDSDKYGEGILDCSLIFPLESISKPTIKMNSDGNIEIVSTASNAKIYYTTDDKDPIIGVSNEYVAPISTKGISTVKAVAYCEGSIPSEIATYSLRTIISEDMYYKCSLSFDTLKIPPNSEIISCYSSDNEVAEVNLRDRKIIATGEGDAKITIYLKNNRRWIVNVNVEYNFFQWLIIVFLGGFLWYI